MVDTIRSMKIVEYVEKNQVHYIVYIHTLPNY